MKKAGEPGKARKRKTKKKKVSPKALKRGLMPKQQLFVREYLVDMNATQAYLRAGYKVSEAVAAVNASQSLRNPKISAAINEVLGRRLEKLDISADAILQELAKMAFGNMLDYIKIQADGTAYVDLSKLTREQAAAIQELSFEEVTEGFGEDARPVRKVKFKLADKKGSLELLGKNKKLFHDTLPVITPEVKAIMDEVVAGTMSVKDAAYKINMAGKPLPEAVKIELLKAQPEAPPPDLPPAMSDEELEAGYQRKMAEIDEEEKKWLPERQADVQTLKDELKDIESFKPDAEPKKGANGQEP